MFVDHALAGSICAKVIRNGLAVWRQPAPIETVQPRKDEKRKPGHRTATLLLVARSDSERIVGNDARTSSGAKHPHRLGDAGRIRVRLRCDVSRASATLGETHG
jgi:hypothetical protein